MPIWICEQCRNTFERQRNGKRIPRFCSLTCYWLWRKENDITAGCFKPGNVPWNKGVKGIRMSPATEFKPGHVSANKLPIGSVTIRNRFRDNRSHAWIKVAEPNVWRLRGVFNWEEHYGHPLPKGLIIHHIDRDTLNDNIANLVALTRGEHLLEHRPEFEDKRREASSKAAKKRWKEYRESKFDSYYWQQEEIA